MTRKLMLPQGATCRLPAGKTSCAEIPSITFSLPRKLQTRCPAHGTINFSKAARARMLAHCSDTAKAAFKASCDAYVEEKRAATAMTAAAEALVECGRCHETWTDSDCVGCCFEDVGGSACDVYICSKCHQLTSDEDKAAADIYCDKHQPSSVSPHHR